MIKPAHPCRIRHQLRRIFVAACLSIACVLPASAAETPLSVGVAAVDITPDYPVRLSGFGSRRAESEGVTQHVWAKAMAIADDVNGPAILIATDNLCVPDEITKAVAERLKKKLGLKLERLAVTATHTHTAPMLTDVAPTLFGTDIPPEHQSHIARYTREFTDRLEQAAEAAVKDTKPAQLSWAVGQVQLAANRRTPGGPVDHDLSVLAVRAPDGKIRAIYFSYACHCVTLSHNQISGDWAGYAQEAIQKLFPGTIAIASVGCGADSNPKSDVTGTNVVVAAQQGQEIADEVKRLLGGEMRPITAAPDIRYDRVDLPLDTPRTRAEWEERTKSPTYAVAYHAKLNLARLDRGESLPTKLNYPIQTWIFGNQLAMVFLPGETVVDYSLRLKREYDRKRLWINGYSNDGRCYIPSERTLREGGYEGGDAMIYYDRPQRFAPGIEQRILDVVYKHLPASFRSTTRTEGIAPLSPPEALRSIQTKPGLKVELVAAEPLIADPVAIDWGPDGRLWVCEMNDYPAGLDGNWQPGGRIKILEDTDHDGTYDKAVLFAENLPFPTGVTVWGRGAFICAAPDILYGEDTDGDGKADRIEKAFSGFFTDNFQARVNSLQLGFDNWIYGANGLLGGLIKAHFRNLPLLRPQTSPSPNPVDIRNRDFRFSPFTGEFETVAGVTQQGRARDDWGNWFGCNNSEFLLHFGVPERYLRRNPYAPAPPPVQHLTSRPEGNRLYPRSRLQERFNDLDQANRTTSACGLGIYRDTLLGAEFYGNAFICETVHNLVHREVIDEHDGEISSARPTDERSTEFLASTDNWFRPVQVRTGPDGALYVVDMYRFLIEHPRWIPAARLAKIDVRAGSDMGRIYRVRSEARPLRPIADLSKLSDNELAAALDSPNGTERDRAHTLILSRGAKGAKAPLEKLSRSAGLPQIRLQALCALDAINGLGPDSLTSAFRDSNAHVRAEAVRLAEPFLVRSPHPALAEALLALASDPAILVIEQLAFSLGEWNDPRAGQALASIAIRFKDNSRVRTAVLSSARPHAGVLLNALMDLPVNASGRAAWIPPLVASAAASGEDALISRALTAVTQSRQSPLERFRTLASVIPVLDERKTGEKEFSDRLSGIFDEARTVAGDPNMPLSYREAALALFVRKLESPSDFALLTGLAARGEPETIRSSALNALRRQSDPAVAQQLLDLWPQISIQARPPVASLLLSREVWAMRLLEAIRAGMINSHEISPADQQTLLHGSHEKVRIMAAELFNTTVSSRDQVLAKYRDVATLTGSAENGADLFTRNCATCHRVGSLGTELGPNLAALRDKEVDYWVKNIFDPNAVVEPRFVAYNLELRDDRSVTGVIKSESSNSILLGMAGGASESIARAEIKSIRPSALSLMPEGLENALSPEQTADLITFLKQVTPSSASPERGSPELVLRDPASVARLILDAAQPEELRASAINSNPQFAADLIREITRDLVPGAPAEYKRIPWIWRIAIAAGKRNDSEQLKRILDVSLPAPGQPLHDWQAVVLGGGLINGVSQRALWPRERFGPLLDPALKQRWDRAIELASQMADDPKVPSGTRYDALRILGVAEWSKVGAQLVRYLTSANAELQMGAVSALGDIAHEEARQALSGALPRLTNENRQLAAAALERKI